MKLNLCKGKSSSLENFFSIIHELMGCGELLPMNDERFLAHRLCIQRRRFGRRVLSIFGCVIKGNTFIVRIQVQLALFGRFVIFIFFLIRTQPFEPMVNLPHLY